MVLFGPLLLFSSVENCFLENVFWIFLILEESKPLSIKKPMSFSELFDARTILLLSKSSSGLSLPSRAKSK